MDNQNNNDFMSVFNGNHVDVNQANNQDIQSQNMFSTNTLNIPDNKSIDNEEEKAHISIVNPLGSKTADKSTYGSQENIENDNRLKSLGVDTNQTKTVENKISYGLNNNILDKEKHNSETKPHSIIYTLFGICLFLFAIGLAIYLVIDYFELLK